ncbi:MAG: peptidoglycan D,D-transpeptidase FtsI family protein [Anaerolineae bacterium]
MDSNQRKRLTLVGVALCFVTFLIVGRLLSYQVAPPFDPDPIGGGQAYIKAEPERGTIYDRNGAVLVANSADYEVDAFPDMVDKSQVDEMATDLAPILQKNRYEILQTLTSDAPFVILAKHLPEEAADVLRTLSYNGIQIEAMPKRYYPQGKMLCHTLGYADFERDLWSGLERYYQQELAGEGVSTTGNISPLAVQQSVIARDGNDLVLTIDRTIQFIVEEHLERGLREYGAQSGTIIVMNPHTGAILALANSPCFNPANYFEERGDISPNPAVSQVYEPGSVMKLVTMAAALDSGTVTPQSTYYDSGSIEVGGHTTRNWDGSAPGLTDMTTLLARSLNVGAATLAVWMGQDTFYKYFQDFSFGRPTGIDLAQETGGLLPLPGDDIWTEAQLATNAYGQGLAVTPLQMIASVSALANDGYLMQPYIVQKNGSFTHRPTILSHPVSRETAEQVTTMAITAVAKEVPAALVDGYTVAGKTGTAQIPENGVYLPDDVIGSFIGWLPADAPEIIILVKLDRPKSAPWGSLTAAPLFADLAQELVILLDIPPDNVRLRADVMAARLRN